MKHKPKCTVVLAKRMLQFEWPLADKGKIQEYKCSGCGEIFYVNNYVGQITVCR